MVAGLNAQKAHFKRFFYAQNYYGGRIWRRKSAVAVHGLPTLYVRRPMLGSISGGLLTYEQETIMPHDLKTLANPFQFTDLDVRTATDDNNEVWFCAKDVCFILDVTWSGSEVTLQNMPENWFMVLKLKTIKGEMDTVFINEAGLYHLIFRSNKPKAKEFANWICETVLPEIRQSGCFGTLKVSDQINISKQIDSISLQLIETKNVFRRKLLQDQLRRMCNLINQPVPPTDWMALNTDQIDLFLEANNG